MELDLYTQTGEKKGQLPVNKEFFGMELNEALIHEALMRQLGNRRVYTANTKTRAEVRGGGRKPFAQKHTGRARQGSIRSPNHVGGGIVFGPRSDRNYKKNMPRKQRRQALFSTLSVKYKDQQVFALEEFSAEEGKPKTKIFSAMLKKLPIKRNALFVLPEKSKVFEQASRNIPNVKSILVNYLNIDDLLKYEKIVFIKESLNKIQKIFSITK